MDDGSLPRALFSKALAPDEPLIETFVSDLSLSGYFGRSSGAAITDRRLIVVDEAHDGGYIDFPFDKIKEIKVHTLYGNSVLRLRMADDPDRIVDVLRFSRTLDDDAEEFAEKVRERVAPVGRDSPNGVHKHATAPQGGRCRSCGRRLPDGQTICPACVDKRRLAVRSFRYLAKYPGATALSFGVTLAITGIQLIPTYLTKVMVDDVLVPRNISMLWWVIGAILAVHGLLAVLNGIHIYSLHWLGNRVIVDLRTEIYAKLQQLELSFYDKRQTGWIMSRVTNDTSFLQHFMVQGVQQIVVHILMVAGIAVVLFLMNWRLALMTLIPLPLVAFGTVWFSRRMHGVYHRIWRRVSNMHAMLGDTIPGIRVVKAFTREAGEIDRFVGKNEEVFTENMRAIYIASYFFPSMSFVMAIGAILLWAVGGYRVITVGDILPGELIAFIGYTMMLYNPIQALSRSSEQVQGAVTAAERLFEILDTKPETEDEEGKTELPDIKGRIEFRNVSFHYEKGDPVLQNVSFTIEPGQMIGLVGSSGSGKSTLINLIARFYKVTEGEILIDGVNINDVKLSSLRSQIGIVLQEPFLFHGTIAENIRYGRPDATFDEVVEAARLANAHKFIMNLPDGYDTRIGERGVGLSGGEKQRISIARAILKNPRILILDEATSAVDTETERLIQEAIDRLTSGRTTIAIAHRLSTLQNADRLIVLQDGKIVESGTHDELLAIPNGVFRKLVNMQHEIARSRPLQAAVGQGG